MSSKNKKSGSHSSSSSSKNSKKGKGIVAQALGFLKGKAGASAPKAAPAAPVKKQKAKSAQDDRDVAPGKSVRIGATREPAKKPKAAAPGSDVFSGKKPRSAAQQKRDWDLAYVPGKVCPALCADKGCPSLIEKCGYCRLFYIKNWGLIQRKRQIMGDGQLTRYIAEIAAKYPDKYLDAVRGDLSTHDAFQQIVATLELETDVDVPSGDDDDFAEENLSGIKAAIDDESFE